MTYKTMIRRDGCLNCNIRQMISDELKNEIDRYFEKEKYNDKRLTDLIGLYELHRIGDALEIISGVWDDEQSVSVEMENATDRGTVKRTRKRKGVTKKTKGV